MDIRTRLISTAERLFDRHGFTATGMDKLTGGAGISSRTLYKYAGSKNGLMAAVLSERGRRFLRQMDVNNVDALFVSLEAWLEQEGSRGCLFLRAWGETGGDVPDLAAVILDHKRRLRERVEKVVAAEIGQRNDELAEEIVILLEGATHTAVYRGTAGVASARRAARFLMATDRKV